ncbi:mycothiol system anti-sigma-R factor [Nesterenkonia xinjiangensis]|uniref:Mycothiol system anti-sigma-R factor n=1 Tax=Nesterenkonia xinjiangensis TaxID=225327 RepID=A0A7Z0GPA3_9MICC|nr:mycothiol system anti-sigma-R factor [Nesterenkonia xinjiangensis]NYJ79209.1 mycothiol system anti-sigma-R factor [Nesterenkonia xinjiangensis]
MSEDRTTEECLGGDCREAEERMERIYEYLDGALSRDDLEEVRTHLHDCPDCASDYDLECIIRSVIRRSCAERAPDTLKVTIMERISEIRIEAGHESRR